MRLLTTLLFIIPIVTFSQEVTKYKTLPKLEKELKNVFVSHTQKHVNITDSLIKRSKEAFVKYDYTDTIEQTDSNFYLAQYTNKYGIFKFYFKTFNHFNPNENIYINNRTITLSITLNDSLLLAPMYCYTTETVESLAEQTHCFLIESVNYGFPDILFVKYVYREFIDNDKFDCKDCKLFEHGSEGYTIMEEVVDCKEYLKEYNIPFVLK